MFQKSISILKTVLICLLVSILSACSWTKDDMSDCPTGCKIKLSTALGVEYSGLFNAQAFYNEMEDANLFVFDAEGIYIKTFCEEGEKLKQDNFILNLPLPPGHYQIVAWCGLKDGFYEIPVLTPGISHIEEVYLSLNCNSDNSQNEQLTPLWHGIITDAEVKPSTYTLLEVRMIKNTNTLITVIQDLWGNDLEADDYNFQIIADNGFMDHRNRVTDNVNISYGEYFKQTAEVDADNEINPLRNGRAQKLKVARAELNTLRLIKDRRTRFVVTHKSTGKTILNINLTEYLLLTRELFQGQNGVQISDQEYLDYEDTYRVIFFLTPLGDGGFACTTLSINGWIIRLNGNVEL